MRKEPCLNIVVAVSVYLCPIMKVLWRKVKQNKKGRGVSQFPKDDEMEGDKFCLNKVLEQTSLINWFLCKDLCTAMDHTILTSSGEEEGGFLKEDSECKSPEVEVAF